MAMFERTKSELGVDFATHNDVCFYCLKELWKKHPGANIDDFNPVIARHELEGKLEGQKVWKHNEFIICKNHISEIADELGAGYAALINELEAEGVSDEKKV